MNERIKELIEQADIKFDKDIESIDVCVLLPSDLEKFAELIVLECCTMMQGFTFEEIAVKAIKNTLGVKNEQQN